MNAPWRPALRYMGGKWRIAPKIVAHFPAHRTYLEPYGGAASVLLQKPRAYQEIYNDLDGELVDLFRVLRDRETALELSHLLALTPFAREEFEASYERSARPVENARRTVVRSFMGFGSTAVAKRRRTGFRAVAERQGKHPAQDFAGLPEAVLAICERLQGVVIEQRPALQLIGRVESPDTLIYADPPYAHETRSNKRIGGELEHAYTHEMSAADHQALLAVLTATPAMVVLSGYSNAAYEAALQGWKRVEMRAHADGGRKRTEVLWINPAAQHAGGLFADRTAA